MNTDKLRIKWVKSWLHYQAALKIAMFILIYICSSVFLPFSGFSLAKAGDITSPKPDFGMTFPLLLGTLDPQGQHAAVLFLHLDQKGLADAQFVPMKLQEGRLEALPPQERAKGLSEVIDRFSGLQPSGWRSAAVFWNGTGWQNAPALAYVRDASPDDRIVLPASRTIQVRDLAGESGGFSTGKAITDLSKEPQTDERIELNNGQLRIWRPTTGGDWQIVFESKPSWQVMQFGFGDADEDGRPEIMFTLWKNDGQDDAGQFRSHPFVYGWRRGEIRPVWAGSALVDPIREFALSNFAQANSDGPQNQLIVLEGSYKDERDAPARSVTVWQWNGWGYELLWRSPAGKYSALRYVAGQPFAFYRG